MNLFREDDIILCLSDPQVGQGHPRKTLPFLKLFPLKRRKCIQFLFIKYL